MYSQACERVLDTLESALKIANDAIGAHKMATTKSIDPEALLLTTLGEEEYSATGAAIEYLRGPLGPTPSAFLEGVRHGSAAINSSSNYGEPGFQGHIYH